MTIKVIQTPRCVDILTLDWALFVHNHVLLHDRLFCHDHGGGVETVVGGFLVLLDQFTASAAPRRQAMSRTVAAIEIVFLIYVVTLNQERQPVEAAV